MQRAEKEDEARTLWQALLLVRPSFAVACLVVVPTATGPPKLH
jgi:hypothetical protein